LDPQKEAVHHYVPLLLLRQQPKQRLVLVRRLQFHQDWKYLGDEDRVVDEGNRS